MVALVAGVVALARAAPLRIVIGAEPVHLNPLLDPDIWGYRLAHDLICEPLVRRRSDGDQGYEGVLAEHVSVDADGTGADVVLRRGVRFHDGRALTAHDVRFTMEQLQGASRLAPRSQALVADLKRVVVLGSDRLRLELHRPSGRLLAALAEVDILPEHHFGRGSLAYQLHNRKPICTGPYRLREWRRGPAPEIVLVRHGAYWGTPPLAEELRFLVVPDGAQALALLRRGGAEVLGPVAPLYVPEQVEPTMLRGRLRRVEVPANQVALLLWNGRQPHLASSLVRRALSLLIDRERLVREVRKGLGEALSLPPPLPGGTGARDVAAAEALLDQAEARRLSPGGARVLGGRPLRLRLLVPAGATEALEVAQRIGAAVAVAGVKLEPEVLELQTLQSRLRRGAFDTALLAWAWTGTEPDLFPLLRRGEGRENSPALAAALEGLRRALGPERRAAALAQLAAVLRAEEPITFLYRPRHLLLTDIRLRPEPPPMSGDFIWLRRLHLDASAAGDLSAR